MWRWTAALAGLAVLGFAMVMAIVVTPASHVQGATSFTVKSTLDDPDADPGDGICATADDDCTLRAAIEEVNALGGTHTITISISGGGTIHLGDALPTITDDNDKLTIHGQTSVTIKIEGSLDFPGLTVDTDYVTLSNLVFNGNSSDADGLVFETGSSHNTLSSVEVKHFLGNGIYFEDSNDNNTITSCDIESNGAATEHGIFFDGSGSDDNTIKTTTIKKSPGSGIDIVDGSDGNTISGGTITKNDTGVTLEGGDDATVSGNTIQDNDSYGVVLTDQDAALIEDNTIGGNDDGQIDITGGDTGEINIYSNKIDTGSNGIVVDTTVDSSDITISSASANCNAFTGGLGSDEYYLQNDSDSDIDATYNDWDGLNDSSDIEDTICANNATDSCGGGDVDKNDWLTDCAAGGTVTPTPTFTPTFTFTPTGTPPTSTPTNTATPTGPTATPTTGPMESVTLASGRCSPVISTYPDGTPIATIAAGVSPSTALISIWWFNALTGDWLGYSPQFPSVSDLTHVDRLEVIFICVSSQASWSRRII